MYKFTNHHLAQNFLLHTFSIKICPKFKIISEVKFNCLETLTLITSALRVYCYATIIYRPLILHNTPTIISFLCSIFYFCFVESITSQFLLSKITSKITSSSLLRYLNEPLCAFLLSIFPA